MNELDLTNCAREVNKIKGKINVLIPSAGGRYLHILYVKRHPAVKKVITTEITPLAPGVYAASKCYKAPRSLDPKFIDFMLNLCTKEKINLIIPLMDLDTIVFSDNRHLFEEKQITLLLAPPETIEICKDKYKTQLSLKENNLPTPETILFSDMKETSLHYPLLLKPRFLSMKNSPDYFLKLISNRKDLRYCEEKLKGKEEKFMLQEYLTGKEITIDFFVDRDNRVISVVPGERIQANAPAFSSHGGAIVRGKTFHSETFTNLILKVAKKFRFFGPSNLQGYSLDGKRIKFTEINPRFTGATVMTKAAGADFFKWSIDLVLNGEFTPQIGRFQEIYMTSWNKPLFIDKPRF